MEASTAAPAAADANGQVAPEAPEQAAPAPAAPATPEQTQAPEGDLRSQLEAAEAKNREFEQKLGGGEQEAPGDILSELGGADDDLSLTPEEIAAINAGQDPSQAQPQDADQQLQELRSYLEPLVDEMVGPIRQERAEEVQERRVKEVSEFAEKHSDIQRDEIRVPVVKTVQNLAARFAKNDQERWAMEHDPNVIELAYKSVKAEAADAGAVPAEQAATNGASLETGAGQTQAGEESEDDKYRKALLGGGGGGSAFG